MKILILNGPNLNLLGQRENEFYGNTTLEDIIVETKVKLKQSSAQIFIDHHQSNSENELVDFIQQASKNGYLAIIINPGAFSHTSVAILDALRQSSLFKIEVHLSQIYQRDDFRQQLLTAKAANSIMCGLGSNVYYIATLAIIEKIKESENVSNN
jgi:3-dehydroquinate dehydratase-2